MYKYTKKKYLNQSKSSSTGESKTSQNNEEMHINKYYQYKCPERP